LIGDNQVNVASAITPITPTQDFEFWFMGTRYTQFSVSSNGILRFGSVPINSDANTPSLNFQQRICAFASGDGDDVGGCTNGTDGDWKTRSGNGRIHFRIIGTAPDRILVTEWLNMELAAGTTTADGTFQIRVHETQPNNTNGGRIEIVYGNMRFPIANTNCRTDNNQSNVRVGIGISQANNEFISLLSTSHATQEGETMGITTDISRTSTLNASYTANAAAINLSSTMNGSRKFYNFVSVAPNGNVTAGSAACISSNSIRLDWTENASNEVGIVIYRSTDNINYSFLTQLAANSITYTDTGLTPSTTYYYKVYTVTEGKLSALNLGFITGATLAAGTVFSINTGNWNNPAIWSTGAVPTATDNVVIGCPTPHVVTVNTTTATCNNLTILSGSNVTIASNQTLTVRGNLTMNDGGGLPKITMTSTSPTLEVRGHWIDLDQTVVAAGLNGVLAPGTSSTVIFGGTANQIINANNATPTLSTIQSTKPMIFHNLVVNGDNVDLIFNDNKPIVINNDLTVNATKSFTYNLNLVAGGVGSIDLKGNMVNNGTIYSRNDGRHFLMSGAAKTITGTGIYTNFPLQIGTTASVSLNTNASMRQLWVLSGGTFTVQNTPRTYTLTRSAVGNTSVELRNQGTFNFSGANVILGTSLDAVATANLINTGTFNAGTNSNFTFSAAGAQTVSNTGVPIPAGTATFTAPAYTAAVNIPDDRPNLGASPSITSLNASGGASMSITVPTGSYTALTSIAFNINHERNDNLDIYLVAPDNTVFEISTDNGANTANYTGTVISDFGADNITAGVAPFRGTFRPEGSTFASYNTAMPTKPFAGTWTLWVIDDNDNNDNEGSLLNFRLNLGNAVFYTGTGAMPENSPTGGLVADNTVPTAAQLFASAGAVAAADVPTGTYTSLANINFSITHTAGADLDIYLVSPNSTVYVISTDNGGSGNNYTNTIISDAGATDISAGSAPFTGTFRPEVGTFASYPAAACTGRWYLYVIDDADNDLGRITNFSVTPNTPAQPVMLSFHNLIMNNTSSTGTTLLDTQITINNATTFTSGRLYTSEAYRVNYIAGSSTSVAAANSYIVGWARKTGNTAFEFPLGNDDGIGNQFAAPMRFTPTSGSAVTDHFTATYRRITPNTGSPNDATNVNTGVGLNTAPYPILTKEASINNVSNREYWILERTNGAAIGTVHLSYEQVRSGGTSLPAELLVCRWNKGTPIWENKGNGGISSSGGFTYVQSTAAAFTAFSPVTLGSTSRFNVLPVTWINFNAIRQNENANLSWETQAEVNNSHFVIERSFDGINFSEIGKVMGSGNSSTNKTYTFVDRNIIRMGSNVLYYRIKQVDNDGQSSYTQIRTVMVEQLTEATFKVYPNPFEDIVMVQFSASEAGNVLLEMTDMAGKTLRTEVNSYQVGNNLLTIPTTNLSSGSYLIRLQTKSGVWIHKVVKQ
jgi:subtilisin-like proprotein convertase family protein